MRPASALKLKEHTCSEGARATSNLELNDSIRGALRVLRERPLLRGIKRPCWEGAT